MLSAAQERYIDWYFMQRSNHSIGEIAAQYGVDASTVDNGLAWCRKHNVGTRQDKAELEKRVTDVLHDIKQIEQDIRQVKRDIRTLKDPAATGYSALTNSLIGFRRELREHKKDLAELQGLLKRVLELTPPGGDTGFRMVVEFKKSEKPADHDAD